MDYRNLENNDIDYERLQEDLIFLSLAYGCVKIIKIITKKSAN